MIPLRNCGAATENLIALRQALVTLPPPGFLPQRKRSIDRIAALQML
jgi:hypothetical protein